jgi:hypothetical protein
MCHIARPGILTSSGEAGDARAGAAGCGGTNVDDADTVGADAVGTARDQAGGGGGGPKRGVVRAPVAAFGGPAPDAPAEVRAPADGLCGHGGAGAGGAGSAGGTLAMGSGNGGGETACVRRLLRCPRAHLLKSWALGMPRWMARRWPMA